MRLLAVYLNDHLTGAAVGVELARRAASENKETALGAFLSELATQIEADRRALEEIMSSLGISRDRLKLAAGCVAQRLARLKLNGRLLSYSPLSRLEELEFLSLGIAGKLALWRSLREIADADDRLSTVRLDELIARAEDQRDAVEHRRLEAARLALAK
jgi:hypothetical protein